MSNTDDDDAGTFPITPATALLFGDLAPGKRPAAAAGLAPDARDLPPIAKELAAEFGTRTEGE